MDRLINKTKDSEGNRVALKGISIRLHGSFLLYNMDVYYETESEAFS
jgi:hypothetical protein